MPGVTDAQREWVRAVLGVELPHPGEGAAAEAEEPGGGGHAGGHDGKRTAAHRVPAEFKARFQAAKSTWSAAIGTVDGQVGELQKAMAKSGDPDIKAIAQHALAGVTGGYKQLLDGYVQALGDGGDEAALRKGGQNLLGAVADFRIALDKDRQIAVMDDNPFGCAVSIRATLGPALGELEAAIRLGLG